MPPFNEGGAPEILDHTRRSLLRSLGSIVDIGRGIDHMLHSGQLQPANSMPWNLGARQSKCITAGLQACFDDAQALQAKHSILTVRLT